MRSAPSLDRDEKVLPPLTDTVPLFIICRPSRHSRKALALTSV